MADDKPQQGQADPVLLVILFGIITGITMWFLTEHDEQANELINLLIGKAKPWVL